MVDRTAFTTWIWVRPGLHERAGGRSGALPVAVLGLDPVVHPGGVPSVHNPVTYSATPPSYRRPPPRLGADGPEIRAWLTADP